MGSLEHSVWIRARPEDVWRTYVDPYRLPEWQTGSPVIADIHGSGDHLAPPIRQPGVREPPGPR
jgi:hypothetical protein